MIPFLKYVADDLRRKLGNDLSRTVVVFPNKRAGLFFNEELLSPPVALPGEPEASPALSTGVPVWSPRYRTISELFRRLSPLAVADPIDTVCRLYEIYREETGSSDSLDFFYGWGEKLLADFDDADKNMADTTRLFCSLREIKEIERGDYVDADQERVLQEFFSRFSLENNSRLRQKFLELWNRLQPIYTRLNAALAADGEAYEGALYRAVVTGLEDGLLSLPADEERYVFVGFNVLDKVEERLFRYLQERGRALFYWDYDVFYAGEDTTFEAGVFLRNNLRNFPNELPAVCFDNLRLPKDIEYVSAPTENAQARMVTPWLRARLTADEKRTAVVLCDEGLLQPVLHALPPEVREVNVTKGFPLHHTSVFTLVETFFESLTGASAEADAAARQARPALLDELAARIRTAAEQDETLAPAAAAGRRDELQRELLSEAYFRAYTVVNRFRTLLERGRLAVTVVTLHRLLRQVLRQTSVPFHGEPVAGLQVMGVLETRNLDFENVLLLSANEGNIPKRVSDNSFIPYTLRREFGMTTARHKTAVFAYYFYRLLQRASHVRMVYNCSPDGVTTGEMSRFMMQLLVESPLSVRHYALTSRQALPAVASPPSIPKPEGLPAILSTLSPSAVNTYLRCQLQFYYQRVARLKEPDPPADVIAPNTFGTIFHYAAELIYKEKLTENGGLITADTLDRFLREGGDARLAAYVKRAFADCGVVETVVVAEVVKSYLKQLIRHDRKLTPFNVVGTELNTELPVEVPYGDATVTVRLKGNIDRLDVVEADGLTRLRVVDYKTGGKPESVADVEQMFVPDAKRPKYALQTFFYALTLLDKARYPVAPALFFVHKAASPDYSPYIDLGVKEDRAPVLDFAKLAPEFRERLVALIAAILDPARPFVATDNEAYCRTCPFAALCHR